MQGVRHGLHSLLIFKILVTETQWLQTKESIKEIAPGVPYKTWSHSFVPTCHSELIKASLVYKFACFLHINHPFFSFWNTMAFVFRFNIKLSSKFYAENDKVQHVKTYI